MNTVRTDAKRRDQIYKHSRSKHRSYTKSNMIDSAGGSE